MERLRDQSADFVDVSRNAPLQMDDFAVIDFEGTIDGEPISEIAPEASKNLHGGKKFWLQLASGKFSAEFSANNSIGQKKEETRLVIVTFRQICR